jgi:membrane protein YdbS with pleckstrin-like domain
MAETASDYQHGDQDIHEQQATFRQVIFATKWSVLYLAAFITLLTLWFCTAAGFWQGLLAAIVILIVGTIALRERPSAH